jgi:hypothetical protein
MQPPAGPIRSEARDAIALGIRTSGPRAVNILLIGLARIFLALFALVILHLIGAEMFEFSLLSIPFASISVLSVALSLMATAGRPGEQSESEEPTRDERGSWGASAEYGSR